MAIRYHHDLYPADDPRDGSRVVRFTHHQKAHYEHVRNGAGSGLVELRGTTSDAQLIAPSGMQYVRVVEENTVAATEVVRGGYFFEEGDFLALDRKRLKKLKFGGTGTLSYLDREVMWSHTYLSNDIDPGLGAFNDAMDPFDKIWRLSAQGFGNTLGAMLWRVVREGQLFPSGPYTHRHKDGLDYTDSHADDKTESAIPFLTLGFDQDVDSDGTPWSVTAGEFIAQVGETLFEVTKRLMDAGLYVELDPDTFELRAWEVANHGRDRTGSAWGTNVVRFEPPPAPSTDRSAGNILNDLKRALRPFIKVTALLAGGGEDTYAVATASGTVPWHRFRPLDINDTTALAAAATRDISRRNDAGDTLLVRSKVGDDPANGYYLPEKHAKLDDLVTVHSGSDTWDWDEAAYPIAKWSVTSRRTGAPDVFYHLGASYHAGASKEFAGGSGVGRHTHPPNPQLCIPAPIQTSTAWRTFEHATTASGEINAEPAGWKEVGYDDSVTPWVDAVRPSGGYDPDTDTVEISHPDAVDAFLRGHEIFLRKEFYVAVGELTGDDVAFSYYVDDALDLYINGTLRLAVGESDPADVTTTMPRSYFQEGLNCIAIHLRNQTGGSDGSAPNPGTVLVGIRIGVLAADHDLGHSSRAKRCDDVVHAALVPITDLGDHFDSDNVEGALQELGAGQSGNFVTRFGGGPVATQSIPSPGSAEELDLTDYSAFELTLGEDCEITTAGWPAGEFAAIHVGVHTNGHAWSMPGVVWAGGVTPSPSDDTDWIVLWSVGGVTIYGMAGAGGNPPAQDTHVWMPLTTRVGGDLVLVADGDDGGLIPTLVPLE